MIEMSPMKLALKAAKEAALEGEVPVGAVVFDTKTRQIMAITANRVLKDKDPTAHAELLAIREAAKILQEVRLTECELYVTLEPCPMCAQAISFARFKRLYYGAYDTKGGGVDHGPRVFQSSSCFHSPEVISGLFEKECSDILINFFKKHR